MNFMTDEMLAKYYAGMVLPVLAAKSKISVNRVADRANSYGKAMMAARSDMNTSEDIMVDFFAGQALLGLAPSRLSPDKAAAKAYKIAVATAA